MNFLIEHNKEIGDRPWDSKFFQDNGFLGYHNNREH